MEGIGFKNMKVLKDEHWFDFKNITLLTGTNNSGKSSIINAMQMLQENIDKKSTDGLLRTEFKVRTNQDKYGSIENFVHNHAKDGANYFEFTKRLNNLDYCFKVEINKGLESYGSIKAISATDPRTEDSVFNLKVLKPYPDFQCEFTTNYKYFVDKFYEKCKNTEILFRRKRELDQLVEQVNNKVKSIEELRSLADEISKQVSVYIVVENITKDNICSGEGQSTIAYRITENHSWIEAFQENYQLLGEIKVFFKQHKYVLGQSSLIIESEYNDLYQGAIKNGLFDFSTLWGSNVAVREKFESIICSYYKKDKEESSKLLCDDLLKILSNTSWRMSTDLPHEWAYESMLFNSYLSSFPDFGLTGSLLIYHNGNEVTIDPANYIDGNLNYKSSEILKLTNSNFFELVFKKIYPFFDEALTNDEHFQLRGKLINRLVYKEINSSIESAILNINLMLSNDYVSSNRFSKKRSFSFNDNNDFTVLLDKVEKLKGRPKKEAYAFINKWLKEFDLADELVLVPDSETGNFKSYLKKADSQITLTDFGLGTNQILPIIFSLAIHEYELQYGYLIQRTVVIEEPEANLHPALQSKLADMFVDAHKKFKVQIIVETHSEYLIRKLQYLVASQKSEVSSDDIIIYYFYKSTHPDVINKKVKQVEKIEIDESGRLSKNFGSGFFDEADNIAIDLFLLNKHQAN